MIWKTGIIPEEWKKSASILIHEKGPSDEPGNFRPITLEDTFQILGCQGRRTGVAVTTVSKSLILGGRVTRI